MMLHLQFLFPAFFFLAGPLGRVFAQIQSGVIEFHGSGSSVGSRCIWNVLETLSGQTKLATRGTYRSTGSGTGVSEFMGNVTHPFGDFASSDYPLSKEKFDELASAGVGIVHLPVIMGAVGVFHSVPLVQGEVAVDLNLTSCLVARIYSGDIDDW